MAKLTNAQMKQLISTLELDESEDFDALIAKATDIKKRAARKAVVSAGTPYVTVAGKVAIKGFAVRLWLDEVDDVDAVWSAFVEFAHAEMSNPDSKAYDKAEGNAKLRDAKEARKLEQEQD